MGAPPLRGFAVVTAPIFSLKKSVACSDLCPTRFSPSGEISALLLAEKSWARNVCFADVSPPSPQKYWQFWVWSLWNIKMDFTPFKKFGFWQCAAFSVKSNNIFTLLFPASTLFSPLFFKLIFLRFFLFPWCRKENCVTINPKKSKKRRCIYAFSLRNRLL